MKQDKTKKAEAQAKTERHYYKLPLESSTGRLIERFWHACEKCEQAADDWCKKVGAKYYYSDPHFFAGGVGCVTFGDDCEPDEKLWQYIGDIEGEKCYLPACKAEREIVEIPSREYQLRDTWDTIYLRDQISEREVKTDDGGTRKVVSIPKICFRPEGDQHDSSGRPIAAGRKQRRAIIAEQKRLRLPVTTVGNLYHILGALLPQGRQSESTPTFFFFQSSFYVACDYPCSARKLTEITPQQYRTAQCKAERASQREVN